MKLFKSLLLILMGSSAFAAGGTTVLQNDTSLTIGSMTLTTGGAGITFADGTTQSTAGGSSSGGSSALGVNFNGISVTTPTAQINVIGGGGGLLVTANGSTATITLPQVSLTSGVTNNLPAAQIAAGSLGASVIVSSLSATSGSVTAGTNITSITGTWPNVTINASGSSGGASALGVNYNGVSVTTPTAQINVTGNGVSVVANGSTATINVPGASGANGLIQISSAGAGAFGSDATLSFSTTTKILSANGFSAVNVSTPGGFLLYELQVAGTNYAGIVAASSFTNTYSVQLPTTTPPAGSVMVFSSVTYNANSPYPFLSTGTWTALPATGVPSVLAVGQSPIVSSVTLSGSGSVTLTQTGNTIAFTSTGSGVPSVNLSGQSAITSSATWVAGTNMTATQVGNTITFNAAGGGGSPNGQVNTGTQLQAAYYSVAGSSNVLSGSSNLLINTSSITAAAQTFLTKGTAYGITSVSGNYTATSTDTVIAVTGSTITSTNPTITLDPCLNIGQILTIPKVDRSTASVTILPNGSDLLAGTTGVILNAFTQTASIVCSAPGLWTPWGQGIQFTPAYINQIPSARDTVAASAANDSIFELINVPVPCALMGFYYGDSVQSGNINLGIFNANGAKLETTGSTVVGSTNTVNEVTLPVPYNVMPGQYYLGVAVDNGTVALTGMATASTIIGKNTFTGKIASNFALANFTPTSLIGIVFGKDQPWIVGICSGGIQ